MNKIIDKTCEWVFTGKLDVDMLAENFHFSSPFYKEHDKAKFLADFKVSTFYKDRVLSGIKNFDPVLGRFLR